MKKIKIGGYNIFVSKYRAGAKIKGCLKLGIKDGALFLLDQDNKPLPRQISIKVNDKFNEIPTAEVMLVVNLSEIINLDE